MIPTKITMAPIKATRNGRSVWKVQTDLGDYWYYLDDAARMAGIKPCTLYTRCFRTLGWDHPKIFSKEKQKRSGKTFKQKGVFDKSMAAIGEKKKRRSVDDLFHIGTWEATQI